MYRKKPDVDVIRDILNLALAARPDSGFLQSLGQQYEARGSLSRKQLEGLHQKSSRIASIPAAKLATLEAVILKMPSRFKSQAPEHKPLYEKDPSLGELMNSILNKYPQHKRVLLLKNKYDSNTPLSAAEKTELQKFARLLT